jgi:hypothetical protein
MAMAFFVVGTHSYRSIEGAFEVIEKRFDKLDVLFLFHVVRFLEVCCQHTDTRQFMLRKLNAVERICTFIDRYMVCNCLLACLLAHPAVLMLIDLMQDRTPMLCLPALGVIRFFILFEPAQRQVFRESSIPNTLLEFCKLPTAQGKLREKAWSAAHLLLFD